MRWGEHYACSGLHRAVSEGLCGVPSYQVNNRGPVVWGQDKQNHVEDLICGWTDITTAAKL